MTGESWERFVAAVRDEMLASIEEIARLSRDLLDRIESSGELVPPQVREDLSSIHHSSIDLRDFAFAQLKDSARPETEESRADPARHLRHEIRNRLNAILGPCQFLLMENLDVNPELDRSEFDSFVEDLETIRQYANVVLQKLATTSHPPTPPETGQWREDLSRPAAPEESSERPDRAFEPAHVLIVDDSELNRKMLARFMVRMGHSCDFAANGREALDRIKRCDYDLVLLDILMPEMNGLEVLRELNRQELLRHMPVLVVSGLDSSEEIIACIELGAEDFLTLPINVTLLRARVNACLEKKRLREREFGQFFPKEIARQVALRPEILDEGREADVSVMFCDIRGFSRISETLPPQDTVRWIRDVMEVLSECVLEHQGVLVDYIGDELVAMWGAPNEQEDHAQLACRAALTMIERIPAISQKWIGSTRLPTSVGIGINSGKAHVGNTGTARRRKYGPLGNTVNLASRVQGATRYLQVGLLTTSETHRRLAGSGFPSRRLCTVKVDNIEAPVDLYQIVPQTTPGWSDLDRDYEAALQAFENREFRVAASMLGNLLLAHPNDGPSLLLMSRVVNELIDDRPSAEFNPVWKLPGK
jgi:adenylate cyclase